MAGEIYNSTGGGGTGLSLGPVGGYPANFTFTPDNVAAFLADLRQQLADAAAAARAALQREPNTQSHDWLQATLLGSRIGKQIQQLSNLSGPVTTDARGYLQSTAAPSNPVAGGVASVAAQTGVPSLLVWLVLAFGAYEVGKLLLRGGR